MIILITPTGARPEQFKLCAKYMKSQDYSGEVLWLIIDDFEPVSTDIVQADFKENWTIGKIYPRPVWQPGQNTQARNIAAGINEVKKHKVEAIFIIEDDDYYKPCYLSEMMKIKGYELWGEMNIVYYNVVLRRWIENKNDTWSSLFQTAFKPSVIPMLESVYAERFIDFVLFKMVKNYYLFDAKNSIGIKGQPGRAGIGAGHGWINHMIPDANMTVLKQFIGEDYKNYEHLFHEK